MASDVLRVSLRFGVFSSLIISNNLFLILKYLQPFADDDLFDAELGAESDGDENIDCTERDRRTRDWADNNSDGEAANSSSDEEAREKRKRVQKKREAKKKVLKVHVV